MDRSDCSGQHERGERGVEMKVNNYACGLHSDTEVYIQTTPEGLEAAAGQVYLTRRELLLLLAMLDYREAEQAKALRERLSDLRQGGG